MIKKLSLIASAILFMFSCNNYKTVINDENYKVTIGEKPKDNRVLTHYKSTDIKVESEKKVIYTFRASITLFEKSHNEEAIITGSYDKFRSLKSLRGVLKDKNGKFIRNISNSDMIDVPGDDGSNLYTDLRIKVANLVHDEFPYTIEYEIVNESTSLLNLPSFTLNYHDDSLTYGKLTVTYPSSNPIRYKAYNTSIEPVIEILKNNDTKLTWEFKNPTNFTYIKYYKPYSDQLTKIKLATTFLNVENYAGRIDTWKSFGIWYKQLVTDKDVLPNELKSIVDKTLIGKNTIDEKVKAIYQLMQDQTRYISVQLGIGGWQPFSAEYVFKNKYGDCKALSNYTYAMLKYAGITSYHALASRGNTNSGVDPDFPANEFNHQILIVPNGDEYIWLECTEQTIPYNHVGSDNQDKYVLAIKPDGGELIYAPKSTDVNSKTITNTTFTLSELGDSKIEHIETHTGNNQDYYRRSLYKQSKKNVEDYIYSSFSLSNVVVNKYNFDELGNREDSLSLSFDLEARSYASRSGSRIIVPLNKLNRWAGALPKEKDRKHEVWFREPILDESNTTFIIPEGFKVEFVPKSMEHSTPFGTYKLDLIYNEADSKIEVKRTISIQKSIIEVENYASLNEFLKKSSNGDAQKIILVKK